MKKQTIITSAIFMGLIFLFSGNVWAEQERPRDRRDGRQIRDRGEHRSDRALQPDHDRQWRGRDGHRARPGRHWAPERRRHVRQDHDRRWRHRRPHNGPRHHWRYPRKHRRGHHWGPKRHHRPRHFRAPARHRRGHGRHHAWQPVVEKNIYHYYDQAGIEAAPSEQFEIAASINDPAGVSFSFGVSGTN